jgi:hypothetical protein
MREILCKYTFSLFSRYSNTLTFVGCDSQTTPNKGNLSILYTMRATHQLNMIKAKQIYS